VFGGIDLHQLSAHGIHGRFDLAKPPGEQLAAGIRVSRRLQEAVGFDREVGKVALQPAAVRDALRCGACQLLQVRDDSPSYIAGQRHGLELLDNRGLDLVDREQPRRAGVPWLFSRSMFSRMLCSSIFPWAATAGSFELRSSVMLPA
jgi:hypothetical protein